MVALRKVELGPLLILAFASRSRSRIWQFAGEECHSFAQMERTPLLPTHVTPPIAASRQPGLQGAAPVENADVDVIPFFLHSLTLLRTAHFPATSQLSSLIDQALESEFLTIERTIWQRKYGRGRIGVGRLTREGENVRVAVRAWLEALKEFGEERNEKDAMQELIHFYLSQEDEQNRNVVTNGT